jgi:hypothetical protein
VRQATKAVRSAKVSSVTVKRAFTVNSHSTADLANPRPAGPADLRRQRVPFRARRDDLSTDIFQLTMVSSRRTSLSSNTVLPRTGGWTNRERYRARRRVPHARGVDSAEKACVASGGVLTHTPERCRPAHPGGACAVFTRLASRSHYCGFASVSSRGGNPWSSLPTRPVCLTSRPQRSLRPNSPAIAFPGGRFPSDMRLATAHCHVRCWIPKSP